MIIELEPTPQEDLFSQQAISYHNFGRNSFSWKYLESAVLRNFLCKRDLPTKKILDAGCGSGRVIEWLIEEDANPRYVSGMDSSRALLEIANRKFSNSVFFHADLARNNLNDNNFDLIICSMVLQNIHPFDFSKTIENFYYWLKKGGQAISIVPHPIRQTSNDLSKYFEQFYKDDPTPWGTTVPYYHRTISDYVNSFYRVGFRAVMIDEPEIPKWTREENLQEYEKYSRGPSRLGIIATR